MLKKNSKKIPPPPPHSKRGLYHEVMESLKIGDSFDVPITNKTGAIYAAAERKGIVISAHIVKDETTNNLPVRRVWRVHKKISSI